MASAGTTAPGTGELDRIRGVVARYFPVYETRVTPQSLVLMVHADPTTLDAKFDELRREMWPQNYVPILRQQSGEYVVEVIRRPNRGPTRPWVNLLLLVLTAASTTAAGGIIWLSYVGGTSLTALDFVYGGIYFAAPLMLILGVHEFAHFLLARRHRVEASLPYFIPVPPPFLIFGTFGAFISLREPIPNKRALLDIGASGPLAGLAVAIPVTIGGLFLSAHAPVLSAAACGPTVLGVNYGNLLIGPSLLWAGIGLFVPVGLANLHPLALAGWVGLLVTAINLLPAGQLDGGHVFRALLGDRSRFVSYAAIAALFGLGFLYTGWFLFAILIFLLGVRHPPPLNDLTPLDGRRLIVGALAAAVLVSGFVIVPLAPPTGTFTADAQPAVAVPHSSAFGMADNLTLVVTDEDLLTRAFVFSGAITDVIGNVSGVVGPLRGAQLAAFEANSSWIVRLPNGNVTTVSGTGAFQLPTPSYSTIASGSTGTLVVTYLNTHQATVDVQLTVAELCAGANGGPQSRAFTAS